MATNSLRPQIVQVMAAHRDRPFTTQEIYEQVAAAGVPDFDPTAKRYRNLVNRELSDLAGCSAGSHIKPAPQLLTRLGRGVYIFRELDRPMDLALVQEYLEVYEKRPPRRRGVGSRRDHVPDSVPDGPLRGAAWDLPRLWHLPAPLPAVRSGPHHRPGRRREDGTKESATALSLLQQDEGKRRRARVPAEDGGVEDPQRADRRDGGRAAGGAHRQAAGPVPPGRDRRLARRKLSGAGLPISRQGPSTFGILAQVHPSVGTPAHPSPLRQQQAHPASGRPVRMSKVAGSFTRFWQRMTRSSAPPFSVN